MKPHHERVVKLEELLEKYENIKSTRDQYSIEERDGYKPAINYDHYLDKEEKVRRDVALENLRVHQSSTSPMNSANISGNNFK